MQLRGSINTYSNYTSLFSEVYTVVKGLLRDARDNQYLDHQGDFSLPAHSFDKANAGVCHSKCPRHSLLHCVARCTFYQYSEAMNTALLIPGQHSLGTSSLGYQLRWILSISQLARRVETHSSGWEWAWETDPAQRLALEARWSWFTCPQGM